MLDQLKIAFNGLSLDNVTVRNTSIQTIVSILIEDLAAAGKPLKPDSITRYTLVRLVKGLASTNLSSRFNYSIALSSVVHALKPHYNAELLCSVLEETLAPSLFSASGGLKNTEVTLLQTAILIGYSLWIDMYIDELSRCNTIFGTFKKLARMFNTIKPLLLRPYLALLLRLIPILPLHDDSVLSPTHPIWSEISNLPLSLASLCLVLTCQQSNINTTDWRCIKDLTDNSTLLSINNFSAIFKLLSAELASQPLPLHPVWTILVKVLPKQSKEGKEFSLEHLWSSLTTDLQTQKLNYQRSIINIFECILADRDQAEIANWDLSGFVHFISTIPNASRFTELRAKLQWCLQLVRKEWSFPNLLKLVQNNFSAFSPLLRRQFVEQLDDVCLLELLCFLLRMAQTNPIISVIDEIYHIGRISRVALPESCLSLLYVIMMNNDNALIVTRTADRINSLLSNNLRFSSVESTDAAVQLLTVLATWIIQNSTYPSNSPISDGLKSASKILKRLGKAQGKVDENFLLAFEVLINLHVVLCVLDADIGILGIQDIKKHLKHHISKPQFNGSMAEVFASFMIKSNVYTKSVAEYSFSLLLPFIIPEAIESFIHALGSSFEDLKEDDEEFLDEEAKHVSSGDKDCTSNSTVVPESSDEGDQVYLDDADPAELAFMDTKLSEIFALRKQETKIRRDGGQNVKSFKSRVLALLDTIIFPPRHRPGAPFQVQLYTIRGIVKFFSKQVSATETSLYPEFIKLLSKHSKFAYSLPNDIAIDSIADEWRNLVATFETEPKVLQLVCQFCWILFRSVALSKLSKSGSDAFGAILSDLWKNNMTSIRGHEIAYLGFFTFWAERLPELVCPHAFSTQFIDNLKSLRPFARVQVLKFLIKLLQKSKEKQEKMEQTLFLHLLSIYTELFSSTFFSSNTNPKLIREELQHLNQLVKIVSSHAKNVNLMFTCAREHAVSSNASKSIINQLENALGKTIMH